MSPDLFDSNPTEHLPDDDFDVLVVNAHTLQSIDLLHLVYQVLRNAFSPRTVRMSWGFGTRP